MTNEIRLRKALAGRRGITEKRMFGGVCFLLRGHMLCATGKNGFMFRVGKEQHSQALAKGAAPVVLGGTSEAGSYERKITCRRCRRRRGREGRLRPR
jgi:TfoX/Sxy family transcriptional regulator of competence genes